MADITVPAGDYGYEMSFTVQDNSGTAYNLTTYTITIKVWVAGIESDPIISGVCTPDVAASGTCHYTVVNGDFDNVGDYLIELELTKAGVVESTQNYTLRVEESA